MIAHGFGGVICQDAFTASHVLQEYTIGMVFIGCPLEYPRLGQETQLPPSFWAREPGDWYGPDFTAERFMEKISRKFIALTETVNPLSNMSILLGSLTLDESFITTVSLPVVTVSASNLHSSLQGILKAI
jgi:hypothetical protein